MDTTIDHHTGSIHTYPTEVLDMAHTVLKIVSSPNLLSPLLLRSKAQLTGLQLLEQQQEVHPPHQRQPARQQQVQSLTPQQQPRNPLYQWSHQ